jgi:hypothetical protein
LKEIPASNLDRETEVEQVLSCNFPRNRRFIVSDFCASFPLIIRIILTGKANSLSDHPFSCQRVKLRDNFNTFEGYMIWKIFTKLTHSTVMNVSRLILPPN